MADDFLIKEYFTLVDAVNQYDKTIITVMGWGVTLSLVALGFGFQYQHSGFFLIAAVSGFGFWAIEGAIKRNQMRYYVRMREIEVRTFDLKSAESSWIPSPQIDWSWKIAPDYFKNKRKGPPPPPERYGNVPFYSFSWFGPEALLPHAISIVVGGILFFLGVLHILNIPF
jgi:hypothetical protein